MIPLLARMSGFSLHAGTVCEAHQRSKLERLCRYMLMITHMAPFEDRPKGAT